MMGPNDGPAWAHLGQWDREVDLPGASGKEALTPLATSSHFTGTRGGCLRVKLTLWTADSMGSSVKQQNFKASPGFYSGVPVTWSRKFPNCLCKGGWSCLLLWAQSILTDIRSYHCHSQSSVLDLLGQLIINNLGFASGKQLLWQLTSRKAIWTCLNL